MKPLNFQQAKAVMRGLFEDEPPPSLRDEVITPVDQCTHEQWCRSLMGGRMCVACGLIEQD